MSGFNIGWNISIKPEFDEMLGFSTTNVVEMFIYYKEHGSIPANSDIDAIVNDMKLLSFARPYPLCQSA